MQVDGTFDEGKVEAGKEVVVEVVEAPFSSAEIARDGT